tara:strand:+ start:141 stop:428 length:288 start_codon:yes stop_codon:yes gene_type:complete
MYKLLNCCRCSVNKIEPSHIRDLKQEFNSVDILNNIVTRSKKNNISKENDKPLSLKNELNYEETYEASLKPYQHDIDVKIASERAMRAFKRYIQT